MALERGRKTPEVAEGGRFLVLPVAAGVKIYEGSLVAIGADGYAKPAAKGTGLTAAGRAERFADNTGGADGDITVKVARGVFVWDNDGSVTAAHVLKDCYIVDDCTVTATSTGSSKAGKVIAVSDDGVAVETR